MDVLNKWAGPDLNRRPLPRKGDKNGDLEPRGDNYVKIDWESFEKWLERDYKAETARVRYSYARKYSSLLIDGDLSPLLRLTPEKRLHVLKGLSALSRFLGKRDHFRALMANYGLKWNGKGRGEMIIARLSREPDDKAILAWTAEAKGVLGDLGLFVDFVLASGLRLNEAVGAWNLIIRLGREGRLNEYFNEKTGALEHFRFKKDFIRRTKAVYISFVPEALISRILKEGKPTTKDQIGCRLKRAGIRLRFSDLRELWASKMTRFLRVPEIDLLQGRVGASIFMANYYNPAHIGDLKERVLLGIEELLGLQGG